VNQKLSLLLYKGPQVRPALKTRTIPSKRIIPGSRLINARHKLKTVDNR